VPFLGRVNVDREMHIQNVKGLIVNKNTNTSHSLGDMGLTEGEFKLIKNETNL